MRKVAVLIILLVLGGCAGLNSGMSQGGGGRGSSGGSHH